jgi:hypothetical protein
MAPPQCSVPADMAGYVVIGRMALDTLRSHRAELPEHLALVVDDAWRVVGELHLSDDAYRVAFRLLLRPKP